MSHRLKRTRRSRFAVLLGLILLASTWGDRAFAQQDERPSNLRPEAPSLEPESTPGIERPEPADPASSQSLWTVGVVVERFVFEGNTAIDDASLTAVVAPYVNRPITSEELVAAKNAVTRLYVERGFVTSGAEIPDQSVRSGEITLRVIEGALEGIDVKGNARFGRDYFAHRIEAAAKAPLEIAAIERVLQRLQRDSLIERVAARLVPGSGPGQSRLVLVVEEARQEDLRISAHNDRAPSVGEESGNIRAAVANVLGRRDVMVFQGAFTEGLVDLEFRARAPLNRHDTLLEARVRMSQSEVVEYPFDPLNIESDSLLVSLVLTQPVWRGRSSDLDLGLRGDWRRGRSTIDGRIFCFQPGTTDCTPTIAVLRGFAEWQYRGDRRAAALRSTVSWGTGWLGATTRSGRVPDGRFVSWLTQMQVAQRMPAQSTLVARANLQLANDPLLAFERIAIGGARTVRGYRPNQLVRDNGVDVGLEWRVPIWHRSLGEAYLSVAPFWDLGYAWNERFDSGDNLISSLGLGLIARPHERIEASVYWGGRLAGVDRIGSGLIDLGLHLRLAIDVW